MTHKARRAATALVASTLLSSALVGVAQAPASADPGFCGVKVNTQGYSGGFLYTGRNKCSYTIRVTAALHGHGLQCVSMPGGTYYTWWSVTLDRAWVLRNC